MPKWIEEIEAERAAQVMRATQETSLREARKLRELSIYGALLASWNSEVTTHLRELAQYVWGPEFVRRRFGLSTQVMWWHTSGTLPTPWTPRAVFVPPGCFWYLQRDQGSKYDAGGDSWWHYESFQLNLMGGEPSGSAFVVHMQQDEIWHSTAREQFPVTSEGLGAAFKQLLRWGPRKWATNDGSRAKP